MAKKWKPPFIEEKNARLFIICAYNSSENSYIEKIKIKLEAFFGKIDFEVYFPSLLPVPSLYFVKEFEIYHLLSFQRPIGRYEIVDIKLKSIKIERYYQKNECPVVEMDIGYITDSQVIRTSLFEENHRIYLYKKIFAETLYYYEKTSFKPFIHTPKFFRSPDVITTFNDLHLIYANTY